MMRRICAATILVLLLAMTPAAPGYAVAGPPVPEWGKVLFDAVLYETTENLSMKALQREPPRRKATSSLLGFARKGSALCPDALVVAAKLDAQFCSLNAAGSDNISLDTSRDDAGFGTFTGDVEVTVQEVLNGNITPDSPEVVIARGRFTGKMDFSPAIVHGIPLGSVDGFVSLGNFSKRVPFHGIFRLPFVPGDGIPALYLADDGQTFPVDPNEMAIGYPTVRFEIFFSLP